ncbi:hypothetical protein ACI2IY_00485 [Lysobacter enzymogenes]|uniref:hypothetical protein n=1 Tax=Lysobacter enzymogenes TaxID=69 RepID=UPI00384B45E8
MKPTPAGSADEPEYFRYSGGLDRLQAVPEESVPSYRAVDDAGHVHSYRCENGWLLDFYALGAGRRRWVVFADESGLYLDRGRGPELLTKQASVRVRMFGCLVFARPVAGFDMEPFTIRFPWRRKWFLGGEVDQVECEPLCHFFTDLAAGDGPQWQRRWRTGRAVRSLALSVLD